MAAGFKIAEAYAEIRTDSSKFVAGISAAQARLQKLDVALKQIGRAGMRFGLALAAGIGLAARAYAKQERAENDLATALRATGQEVEGNMRRFKELAAGIQKVTTYGDEQILAFQAYATHLGVTADKLDGTTRAALGLSKALGMDLQTSMRYTALALQGEFTMLQRYIPELRATESATEKLAIVMRKGAQGFEAAMADTKTLAGGFAQMKNQIGDAAEAIGQALLPALMELTGGIGKLSNGVRDWAKLNAGMIVGATKLGLALAGVAILAPKLLAAVTAIKAIGLALVSTTGAVVALGAAVAIVGYNAGKALRNLMGLTDWTRELAKAQGHLADLDRERERVDAKHEAAVKRQEQQLVRQGKAWLGMGQSMEQIVVKLRHMEVSGDAIDRAIERLEKFNAATRAAHAAFKTKWTAEWDAETARKEEERAERIADRRRQQIEERDRLEDELQRKQEERERIKLGLAQTYWSMVLGQEREHAREEEQREARNEARKRANVGQFVGLKEGWRRIQSAALKGFGSPEAPQAPLERRQDRLVKIMEDDLSVAKEQRDALKEIKAWITSERVGLAVVGE